MCLGSDLRKNELTLYPDGDDGDNWKFPEGPVDSSDHVWTSLRQDNDVFTSFA